MPLKLLKKTEWIYSSGLLKKSYCPLHPDVHKIVFALIDELTAVFETDLFHAGMDEVFYIGDDKCPRCSGCDKAELEELIEQLIENHEFAAKMECLLAAMEHYYKHHTQIA
ncbi:MAG: family 20 glycosylhydrolase [Tannerella sp.]|nr:family 20 glycosylhydrolase [Tannerella sp.]